MSDINNPTAEYMLKTYQEQLDPDGVNVGVSRQALDEVLEKLTKAQEESEQLKGVVEAAEKLAEVKHHKDHKGKDDWYLIHQPAAWVRLFEALNKLKRHKEQDGK